MPACPVCALDRATLDRGICDVCRRDHHVTRTDPEVTGEFASTMPARYQTVCTCGWSSILIGRDAAIRAGRMHRANAQIQTS